MLSDPSKSETLLHGSVGGLVLAGGRSTRFGSEKAAAIFGGRSLLEVALDHLAVVANPVAVSAAPGSQAQAIAGAKGLTVLHDKSGDPRGPLAGVRAGLQWAAEKKLDFLAVEPCDAPRLPPDLHARLWAEIGEAPAAFAQTCEGVQPLCSLWRPSALAAVEAALSSGEHPPVWRLLGEIGAVAVYFPGKDAFTNANTRETLERTR